MILWYDTKDGIESAIAKGLEGFERLYAQRHAAGYDRKERMRGWFVMHGKFWLDTCGNLMRCTSKIYLPDMVTSADEDSNSPVRGRAYTPCSVPSGSCPKCHREWTMNDAHQAREIRPDTPGMPWTYEHRACEIMDQIARGISELQTLWARGLVQASGVPDNASGRARATYINDALRFIPNCYWRPDLDDEHEYPQRPWAIASTDMGEVSFGLRKRVWEIDWSRAPGLGKIKGRDVVSKPDVTHGEHYVHCWDQDDVVRVLGILLRGTP